MLQSSHKFETYILDSKSNLYYAQGLYEREFVKLFRYYLVRAQIGLFPEGNKTDKLWTDCFVIWSHTFPLTDVFCWM